MNEAEKEFYLETVVTAFARMSKREKKRMWRKHRLMHIALSHLLKGAK